MKFTHLYIAKREFCANCGDEGNYATIFGIVTNKKKTEKDERICILRFNWKEELPKMPSINMAVIQLLNIAVIVFFFLVAYISVFHTRELLSSDLGKTVLLGIALFWLIRL